MKILAITETSSSCGEETKYDKLLLYTVHLNENVDLNTDDGHADQYDAAVPRGWGAQSEKMSATCGKETCKR